MRKRVVPWPVTLSAGVYRLLLAAYPRRFRREYGREMALVFRDCCRDAHRHGGALRLLRLWPRTLRDLAASALRERFDGLRRPGQRRGVAAITGRRSRRERLLHRRLPGGQRMYTRKRLARLVAALVHALRRHHATPAPAVLQSGSTPKQAHRRAGEGNHDRFEKYTRRARRALALALEEAQSFNHNYMGTEHLLLGLLRAGDGVAAETLTRLGVDLQAARHDVEHIIGRSDRIVLGEIGLTPRVKKVLALTEDEARRMGHPFIGTEHLLLGLIREGQGIAAGVLEHEGVRLGRAREEVWRLLRERGALPDDKEA